MTALSRRRAATLATLLVLLVAYGAGARHLPGLPSGLDVAFQAAVVFPAFAAAIWLGLPLWRTGTKWLLVLAVGMGALAIGLSLLGIDSAANVAKLACYALAGFCFLTLFEELWWLALIAVLVPWVDVWSVAAGPTEYVVEEKPGIFEGVAVAFPNPGETGTVSIGPPDIVFFSLFLAAADRFGLRVVRHLDRDECMPRRDARPRLVVGRHRRPAGTSRDLPGVPPAERGHPLAGRPPRTRGLYRGRLRAETDSTCGVCGNMSTGRQRTSS